MVDDEDTRMESAGGLCLDTIFLFLFLCYRAEMEPFSSFTMMMLGCETVRREI